MKKNNNSVLVDSRVSGKEMEKIENSKEIMVDEFGREYKKIVILDLDSVIGIEWRVVK